MWSLFKRHRDHPRPDGLVDVHNHLLYGVDDGARTPEESFAFLKGLREVGYRRIIATPHTNHYLFPPTDPVALRERKETMAQICRELSMEIKIAGEVMLRGDYPKMFDRDEMPHLGNGYLVEFDNKPGAWAGFLPFLFESAMKGRVLIVAHPERYGDIQHHPEWVSTFRRQGALVQINVGSLSGQSGHDAKRTAWRLIEERQVDFVGSDMHTLAGLQGVEEGLQSLWEYDNRLFRRVTMTNPMLLFNEQVAQIE